MSERTRAIAALALTVAGVSLVVHGYVLGIGLQVVALLLMPTNS